MIICADNLCAKNTVETINTFTVPLNEIEKEVLDLYSSSDNYYIKEKDGIIYVKLILNNIVAIDKPRVRTK